MLVIKRQSGKVYSEFVVETYSYTSNMVNLTMRLPYQFPPSKALRLNMRLKYGLYIGYICVELQL